MVVGVDRVLRASCRNAVEEVRSAEACEYAEVETGRVETELVENQNHKVEEGHSGTEARFEIVGGRSGIVEGRSGTEVDRFEIEGDHPGMAEVRSEIEGARSGTEAGNLVHPADLDTAEVAQMADCAC